MKVLFVILSYAFLFSAYQNRSNAAFATSLVFLFGAVVCRITELRSKE